MQTQAQTIEITPTSRRRFPSFKTFFNRQWWWTTLLVMAAIGVMARLGVWQLDRRDQRRARNADIVAKLALPPLSLTDETLPADVTGLKNRLATAQGEYDFEKQVALTQQPWMDRPGFHLIAPLVIEGTNQAVLVDRGWLPAAQQAAENWAQYDVDGPVAVTGFIKLSQTRDQEAPGQALAEWYRVDVPAIQAQMPYELLPVYLQLAPSPETEGVLPYREELETDLSDGPHLSYAIQWFIFATILGVGYVHLVNTKNTDTKNTKDAKDTKEEMTG